MKLFVDKILRKIFICLLIALFAFHCVAPLSALAEDNTIYRVWNNLTWSLNYDTGEMVIGGSGDFPNISRYVAHYPLDALVPWYYCREEVKSLVIGDEITSVSSFMFQDFDNLKTVHFGSKVEEIFVATFDMSDNIESFSVAEDNEHFTVVDGILYNKDMSSILRYPAARHGAFSIPETVTTIEGRAFYQCFHLTDITIPSSITNISAYAFFDCKGLTKLIIPDSVTKINAYSFAYCSNVTELYISESLKTINACAFYGLKSLTHLTLPRDLYEIKANGFSGCTSLKSVIMFNKLRSVHLLFDDCDNLTDIYYIGTEEDTQKFNIRPDHLFYPYNLHYGISGTLSNGIAWELETNKKTLTLMGSGAVDGSESIWSEYGEFFNCVYASEEITGIEKCIGNTYECFGTETVNGVKYKVYSEKYIVSYDANGGYGAPKSQSKMHGKMLTLSGEKPKKDGFVFLGWSTDQYAYAPSYYIGGQFDKNEDTVLYAVWGTLQLTGISIVSPPSKSVYKQNEELDTSGMVIQLTYNDGTSKSVTDGFSVNEYNPTVSGQQTVTVNYNGFTASFTVTVIADDVAVTEIRPMITKTEYMVGEEFDASTLSVNLIFSDGTTQTVTDGFTVEGFNSDKAGKTAITVSYEGLTARLEITVKETNVIPDTEVSEDVFFEESEEDPIDETHTSGIEENVISGRDFPVSKSLLIIVATVVSAVTAVLIIIVIIKRKKS